MTTLNLGPIPRRPALSEMEPAAIELTLCPRWGGMPAHREAGRRGAKAGGWGHGRREGLRGGEGAPLY